MAERNPEAAGWRRARVIRGRLPRLPGEPLETHARMDALHLGAVHPPQVSRVVVGNHHIVDYAGSYSSGRSLNSQRSGSQCGSLLRY